MILLFHQARLPLNRPDLPSLVFIHQRGRFYALERIASGPNRSSTHRSKSRV